MYFYYSKNIMSMYLLDNFRINEESCEFNFDYLINLLTQVRENNEYIYIDAQYINLRKKILSYKDFTPALHYNNVIHRIVISKRIDVLKLLDEYREGLVDWWAVLQSILLYHKDEANSLNELENLAWNGILNRNQTNIHIYFFIIPRLFVYTYNKFISLPLYHVNLYNIRKEFINQVLDPQTNCFPKDWMNHKEARELIIKIRANKYNSEDCLENRYIEYLQSEKEKKSKIVILSLFLPDSLRDVIKYIISSYL